ncbi:MAG: hypothetical protein QM528_07340 [Phycisphaerales bacterium]|nr:hypothetical protein [Phycisphaerales bacterium]
MINVASPSVLMPTIKIAILDLYNGHKNQGMRCLQQIVMEWGKAHHMVVDYEVFNVRQLLEVPDLSFDVYISTGGPGSPTASSSKEWDKKYIQWLDSVENWNKHHNNIPKYVFFICHSFQIACRHYKIAKVCKRVSTSFGIFLVHTSQSGKDEIIFKSLSMPSFYVVDNRNYQIIQPNADIIKKMGAHILAIEKERPHVPYPQAIMAIRFNKYFVGTQFHPEADAMGMHNYLDSNKIRIKVIQEHGEKKWKNMLLLLKDKNTISFTQKHIIPNFLTEAYKHIMIRRTSVKNRIT